MSRALILLASVALARGYLLHHAGPPLRGSAGAGASGGNSSAPAHKVAPAAVQGASELKKLQFGLETIKNLRSQFSSDGPKDDGSKFAYGALSEELSKKDSGIWSTLTDMLNTATEAMQQMNHTDKNQQQQLMAKLEKTLDSKAGRIMNLTQSASKAQESQDEEYLLGLLNMHREWTLDQQLNATGTFMKYSPVIEQLYRHHDTTRPLAPQLAALMDAKKTQKKKTHALLLQLLDIVHK